MEPTALYVALSMRKVASWTSSDKPEDNLLPGGVTKLISQIYDDIEREYGSVLTRTALGLITFAKDGVSDMEMEDMLSMDEGVLNFVFQYSSPNIRRLPSHVWLRIRFELTGLVTERGGGRISWYHRQLWEEAERRYSADGDEKCRILSLLGAYFGNSFDRAWVDERKLQEQPLVLNDKVVWHQKARLNHRRTSEAAVAWSVAALTSAEATIAAANEMCSMEAVCAYCVAGQGLVLNKCLLELSEALEGKPLFSKDGSKMEAEHLARKRLFDYSAWLRLDLSFIQISPRERVLEYATMSATVESVVHQDAVKVAAWARATCQPTTVLGALDDAVGDSWSYAVSLNHKTGSKANKCCYEYHKKAVERVAYSPDGTKLLSCSDEQIVIVWDAKLGTILFEIPLLNRGFHVLWVPDGRSFLAFAPGWVQLHDARTGSLVARGYLDRSMTVNHAVFHPLDNNSVMCCGRFAGGGRVGGAVGVIKMDKLVAAGVESVQDHAGYDKFLEMASDAIETASEASWISVSCDGKYMTTVTNRQRPKEGDLKDFSLCLYLWDAQTMKLLSLMMPWDIEGEEVELADGSSYHHTAEKMSRNPENKCRYVAQAQFHPKDPDVLCLWTSHLLILYSISGAPPQKHMLGKKGVIDYRDHRMEMVKQPDLDAAAAKNCPTPRLLFSCGSKMNYSPQWSYGCFSKDGRLICGGAAPGDSTRGGGVVTVVSFETMTFSSKLMYTRWAGSSFDFHPNGLELAAGDGGRWITNYGVHLLRLNPTLEECPDNESSHRGCVGDAFYMGVTPDDSKLLVACTKGFLTCFDTRTFEVLWQIEDMGGRLSQPGMSLDFDDEGKYTVVCTEFYAVVIDVVAGTRLGTWDVCGSRERRRLYTSHWRGLIATVKIDRSGRYIAAQTCLDARFGLNPEPAPKPETSSVVILPNPPPVLESDGRCTFEDIHQYISWDDGDKLDMFQANGSRADVEWHPSDPSLLAYLCGAQIGKVARIDFASKTHEVLMRVNLDVPHFCAHVHWTPDGKLITFNGEHGPVIKAYDPFVPGQYKSSDEKHTPLIEWNKGMRGTMKYNFHENGKHMLFSAAEDDAIHIYDSTIQKSVMSWPHRTPIKAAIWSRDHSRVYSGLGNNGLVAHVTVKLK